MRTTLSIDDDVLDSARRMAADQGRSLGAVVSELARRGLTPSRRVDTGSDGLPVVRSATRHAVTDEAVAAALDEW